MPRPRSAACTATARAAASRPCTEICALAAKRNFERRWRERIRSLRASSVQRTKSRKRSSASLGTNAKPSSPAANSRTRRLASRRSVFTRSPGALGIDPGATTRISRPRCSATRARANPVGPASYTAATGDPAPPRTPPPRWPALHASAPHAARRSTDRAARQPSAPGEHQARQGPYSQIRSAPPIAGVSAPGPSRRPVPAHLCAGCRPILPHTPKSRRSIGSKEAGPPLCVPESWYFAGCCGGRTIFT